MIKFLKTNLKIQQNGYVTIIVLIFMMVLTAITYLYSDAIFTELTIARNNKGASVAFSLAEAGVQEAVYKIQYEAATRDTFLNTVSGVTNFSHDPALINNGAYQVTIQNTAEASATVTAIGTYKIGTLRTARREIKVDIAQATSIPPYNDDGAMFSHSAGGESTGDLEFDHATVNIYGGSLHSGRDISFKASTINVEQGIKAERNINNQQGSTVNCNCNFVDDGDPLTPMCSDNPGCSYTYVPQGEMPMIDFDSSSPNSYKNRAISQNQYYTSEANFYSQTSFGTGQTKTFNGVVYVEGGITIKNNRTLNMNGVLATSGSIEVGGSQNGTLNINPPSAGQPAGAIAEGSFEIDNKGNFSGTALIYAGFRVEIESSSTPITFTGGILSRRIEVEDRVLNIYFDNTIINDTLDNPADTPIIEINHWEEEY